MRDSDNAGVDGLSSLFVMPGLVPGIHVLGYNSKKDVDGRVIVAKTRFALLPGHDGVGALSPRQIEDALGDDAEHHL